MSARVWLIGENNPYGPDPEFALYPAPDGCSGWRLCRRILQMDRTAYLGAFERRNLLSQLKWSAPAARAAAMAIMDEATSGDPFILCGAKVAAAFGLPFEPFKIFGTTRRVLVIPHPSGLSRVWNEPGAFARARAAVIQIAPHLALTIGAAL